MQNSHQVVFFSNEINKEKLLIFSQKIRLLSEENSRDPLHSALIIIIESMCKNGELFDKYCSVNIEWIGRQFIEFISDFSNAKEHIKRGVINEGFAMAYRFWCEREFSTPSMDSTYEHSNIESIVDANFESLSGNDRSQVLFARNKMPVIILKRILNDPEVSEVRNHSITINAAKQLKVTWDSEMDQRQKHVEAIKNSLKEATSTYNFVGLVQGFQNLMGIKIKEKRASFNSLVLFSILMVLPPILQIIYIFANTDKILDNKEVLVYALPATITLEILLLYFFRIVLLQFRSVKAQILQLDLRIALCQFIESYSEYSTKINKESPNALTKFETVIFSNLVSESGNIPSTFDGVDQLANLIKSIRSK